MRRQVTKRSLLKKNIKDTSRRQTGAQRTSRREATLYQFLSGNPRATILIIQPLSGLGDQIMVLPLLRAVKEKFPACHLTLAYYRKGKGKSADIYYDISKHCPWIDDHADISTVNRLRYDYHVDVGFTIMQKEVHGKKGRIDYFRERAGFPPLKNPTPFYHELSVEAVWAKNKREQHQGHVVALHVDSEEIRRSWPPEKYIELVELAAEKQPETTFWVFDFNERVKEWDKHDNVVNYSRTSVREMASLIKAADVYVGPDSGPMHVAAAVGTKAVIIFGPIPHQARVDHYPTHTPIQSLHLECCPCWYRKCPFALRCLKDIRAQDIFNQYTRLL